jgi:hypothetical protein
MLKKYDLKLKRDSKLPQKKAQKNIKVIAKNFTSQLNKNRRSAVKVPTKVIKPKGSILTDQSLSARRQEEVIKEGKYSVNELEVLLGMEPIEGEDSCRDINITQQHRKSI